MHDLYKKNVFRNNFEENFINGTFELQNILYFIDICSLLTCSLAFIISIFFVIFSGSRTGTRIVIKVNGSSI